MLQAIGDPVRLQIVRILDQADGVIALHEIALPVSKSTGSHHLKVLREAGVVQRAGRRHAPLLHPPA